MSHVITLSVPADDDRTEDEDNLIEGVLILALVALDDGMALDDVRAALWAAQEAVTGLEEKPIH